MSNSTLADPLNNTINTPKEVASSSSQSVYTIGGKLDETEDNKEKELPLGYNEPTIFNQVRELLNENPNEEFFNKVNAEWQGQEVPKAYQDAFEDSQLDPSKPETATPISEGTISFHGGDILDQAKGIASEAWSNGTDIAINTAKETVSDITELFGKDILGVVEDKQQEIPDAYRDAFVDGQLDPDAQAEIEQTQHEKQWNNQLETDAKQSEAQEEQEEMKEMERVTGQIMSKEQVQQYLEINSEDVGNPYHIQRIRAKMMEQMQAQEQQANTSVDLNGEIDYFGQINMAGERTGQNAQTATG